MAITRRQFVTRLGALAAAAGLGQADISRSQKHSATAILAGDTNGKPRVVWVHGAECTGCSTSVLGLFEDAAGGLTVPRYSTLAALDLAVGGNGSVPAFALLTVQVSMLMATPPLSTSRTFSSTSSISTTMRRS